MTGPLLIITVHRGAQEIGGNCIELKTATSRLFLDVGMPSSEMSDDGGPRKRKPTLNSLIRRGVIKPIPGLFAPGPKVDGIVLSHAHLGHAGLIEYTLPDIPVYLSSGTSKVLQARSLFAGGSELPPARQKVLIPGKRRRVGGFLVTPYLVDHSCYGSMAFLIETKGKRIAYSGDLRQHGRRRRMTEVFLRALSKAPLNLLIMEGTALYEEGALIINGPSEQGVENLLVEHLNKTSGLALAMVPPHNVDCLVSYVRAASRTGRALVLEPDAAFVLHRNKNEYKSIDPFKDKHIRIFIPKHLVRSLADRHLREMLPGMQEVEISLADILAVPGKFLMISRKWSYGQIFEKTLPPGSTFVYSYEYRYQPWLRELCARLHKSGCSFKTFHANGHFYSGGVRRFIELAKPYQLLPIHTTDRRMMEGLLVIRLKNGQSHFFIKSAGNREGMQFGFSESKRRRN